MNDHTGDAESAKVIPIDAAKARLASERKWGKKVLELGFCIVPSLLLRGQRRLGLNASQLAVLMHLADYWWDVDRKPWPSKKSLAERMNLKPRRVQTIIAELEKAGLVRRVKRHSKHRGQLSNEYDLSGLVLKLQALEPEFRKAEEAVKEARRQVARPGARLRRAVQTPAG
jgi:predicted transcriptional regulator